MQIDKRTIIDIDSDPALSKKITSVPKPISVNKVKKFHWVPDKIDKRDFRYKPTATRVASTVDLRPHCTAVENQGTLGSCTGQAIAGAIELLNKRNKKSTDVSRLYIYYYERLLIGTVNYDSGAYIRDGIKATNKYGAPLEVYWPYNIQKFRVPPSKPAVLDGAKRKVTLYEKINDFNGCLDALTNGYPITVGYYVYSSFMNQQVSKTGVMPYPDPSKEYFLGGHAVLLVGYSMQRQVFIARNSWGSNWGDKGYFYMPFDVIKNTNMSSDFWIIKSVNNP